MSRRKLFHLRHFGLMTLMVLSVMFLMADFCQDVLSIPIKVDYTQEDIDFTVNFSKMVDVNVPGDGDQDYDGEFNGDYDTEKELDVEFNFDPKGYDLSIQHETIDFTTSQPEIAGYKDALLGVFVRSVKYEIESNNIPAHIPPLNVYLTPRAQGDGEAGTTDWDTLIKSGAFDKLDLPEDGEGDQGLIKLGETEQVYYGAPINFPSAGHRLIRQTANIDDISETILSNFRFEVVIVPTDKVILNEADKDQLPANLIGRLKLKLQMIIVVIVKA